MEKLCSILDKRGVVIRCSHFVRWREVGSACLYANASYRGWHGTESDALASGVKCCGLERHSSSHAVVRF